MNDNHDTHNDDWTIRAIADRIVTEDILKDLLQTNGGELAYQAARDELMKMPVAPLLKVGLIATDGDTIEKVIGDLQNIAHMRAVSVVNYLRATLETGFNALN